MKKYHQYFYCLMLQFTFLHVMWAQPQIAISVSINENDSAFIYQDEPLLIEITLSNRKAQADERWNLAVRRRLSDIDDKIRQGLLKPEAGEVEKKSVEQDLRSPATIILGTETIPWSSSVKWKFVRKDSRQELPLLLTVMKNPAVKPIAILDANGFYKAYFKISPGELQKIHAGTYELSAMVQERMSDPVILNTRPGKMPAAYASSELVLLQQSLYAWHDNNPQETIRFAEQVLAKNPNSLEAMVLKGDGLALGKLYSEAKDVYLLSIKAYYGQYGKDSDPPEYLLTMVEAMKKAVSNDQ